MNYKPVYFLVFTVVLLLGLFVVYDFRLTGYAVFQDSSNAFSQGSFENTTFDGQAVVLVGTNTTGAFTSRVFDANLSSSWNTFNWTSTGEQPIFFVRSCDDSSCFDDPWNQLIFDSGSNLTNVRGARYFQYRALFYSTTNGSTMLKNVSIDYTVLPITLDIVVNSPSQSGVYGYNDSILLNYSISSGAMACWYSIDAGSTVSLPGCTSSFISVSSGDHVLTVYANASDGYVSSTTVNFTVKVGYPTILPLYPDDGGVYNSSLQFDYYVNSSDLTGCSLFADFTGSWGTSDTDTTPENGEINSFSQTPASDGSYIWGVECNDVGVQSETLNRTFSLDREPSDLTINQPTGTFSSKAKIPVSLNVGDASATTCVYSLAKIGSGTILVVVMPQCQGTSFNVAEDGNYVMTVIATDAGGNTNTETSSFSVESTSDSSGSGDDSGGVSVDVGSLVVSKLSFGKVDSLSFKPGYTESRAIVLSNIGTRFLNNCRLLGKGVYSSWIGSSHVQSLGVGQRGTFDLNITVPRDSASGSLSIPLTARCDEFEQTSNLSASIIPADFLLKIIGSYRKGTSLIVNYSLEDLTGSDQFVLVHYSLLDSRNLEVTFGDVTLPARASSKFESQFSFELPKDSYGQFMLVLNASAEHDSSVVSQSVLLTTNGATGLAISEGNKHTLAIWGVIILIAGAAYGVWYFVRRMKIRSESGLNV